MQTEGSDLERAVEPTGTAGRYIVCGATPLACRLIEELIEQYEAEVTAIVPRRRTQWTDRIRRSAAVAVVEADRLDADAFNRAGLAEVDALALVDSDDAGNVDTALLAQELRPNVRLVIRMFSQTLGDRITDLLNNCAVLSAAAIAAPAFVASALDEASGTPVRMADRTLATVYRDHARSDQIVAGLAVLGPRGGEPELLPADADDRADLVLAVPRLHRPPRRRPPRTRIRVLPILLAPRLRFVIAIFLSLFVLGTAGLAWTQNQSWPDAAYQSLTAELSGNPVGPVAGAGRLVLLVLVLASAGLIPVLTAAVVDSLIKARLRLAAGGPVDPIADHVVVVGLGDVGTRVVSALNDEGVAVVAIDRDPGARGVQAAHDAGIPVVIGDASRAETMTSACIARSRALVITSSDDVSNLETALLGRSVVPNLRVVLRLFDGEFADRVRRAFNINTSRSVSYLAAPAFATAMFGREVITTIPVRRHVLLVAELPVGANCVLEHQPISVLSRPHACRLLAIRTGDGAQVLWRPSGGRPVRRTDRLLVVATRAGLSQLLSETATRPDDDSTPFRLLEPWTGPRPGPLSSLPLRS